MAQAVERAKQVTMTELNAIIGVRGLPNLPLTVCIPPFFLLSFIHQLPRGWGGKTARTTEVQALKETDLLACLNLLK